MHSVICLPHLSICQSVLSNCQSVIELLSVCHLQGKRVIVSYRILFRGLACCTNLANFFVFFLFIAAFTVTCCDIGQSCEGGHSCQAISQVNEIYCHHLIWTTSNCRIAEPLDHGASTFSLADWSSSYHNLTCLDSSIDIPCPLIPLFVARHLMILIFKHLHNAGLGHFSSKYSGFFACFQDFS